MRPKILLSYILLGIYGLVFVHDLIPHCHAEQLAPWTTSAMELKHSRHFDFHSHNSVLEQRQKHGLLDYLVCILVNMDHSDDHAHGCHIMSSATGQSSNEAPFVFNLCNSLLTETGELHATFPSEQHPEQAADGPLLKGLFRRGPPAVI